MSDYIKRDDAVEKLEFHISMDLLDDIIDIPPADVTPVRHGKWEVIDAEEPRRYGCSECKRLSWYRENYCPNCGAKMDEENTDAE